MTKTTMTLKLEAGPRVLTLGPGQPADITKCTGLEATTVTTGLSSLSHRPGSSLDGVHEDARPIHIEGGFRSNKTAEADREQLIRFFDPTEPGYLTATVGSRTRRIKYQLEGWNLKDRRTLDVRVGFVADLICPDPYFESAEPITTAAGHVDNDGDAEAYWTAVITAGGNVTGPYIENEDTGERIAFGAGMSAGDELIVSTDPDKQTALLNGSSIFSLITRDSVAWHIPVGGCTIKAGAESGTVSVSIVYRERFRGI